MSKLELLAIVAAIAYVGDGIEAAIIAAATSSEPDGWRAELPKPPADGATPRIGPAEAVAVALELLEAAAPVAWRVPDADT